MPRKKSATKEPISSEGTNGDAGVAGRRHGETVTTFPVVGIGASAGGLEALEEFICVVLSGTGTDGTLGLKAVKGASGMAMVQQPQSAKYAGMPSSAIATNLADYVLDPASMPDRLVAYASGAYLHGGTGAAEVPILSDEPMEKIFVLLRSRTGHDFSAYKRSTLRRRIERRMNIHQIGDPERYVRYLQENPHEIDLLFKELLIVVTHFFRDAEAWEYLAGGPLEALLKSLPDDYAFRVWVPGCATGEEVYTMAIVLRECMDRINRHFDVQIFGTDLDSDAIGKARVGRFPDGVAGDVTPGRLKRYFMREDGGYRLRGEIREMVIFAPQNVIRDPPFTKLDLISCRNLLIYLNADLQKKLLPIFHYSLRPGGLLFLGPSETVGSFGELFVSVDKRWKIFRRKEIPAAISRMADIPAQAVRSDSRRPISITEQAKKLVNLIPTDIGRPIGDLLFHVKAGELVESCREVIDTLIFEEREVQNQDGNWYLMRIMPYRTTGNVIEGLVITFVNIDKVKRVEESGKRAREFSEAIVDTVREPLVILDDRRRVVSANRSFYRTFKTSSRQTEGETLFDLGAGQWDLPELRRLLGKVLAADESFEDLEVDLEFPKIRRRVFMLNGRRLQQGQGLPGMILLAMEEVTNP